MIIAPSILSANFARLSGDIKIVEDAGADWLHIDVMDGHFVPNITIGPQVVADIRKTSKLLLDVHLMIERPDQFIPAFAQAGADLITVHAEACVHLHRTLELIRSHGCRTGVSLNPATSETALTYVIKDLDLVLVMSVNPGFGGQQYITAANGKIAAIKRMLADSKSNAYLEVDGGINQDTGWEAAKAGANVLVAGSYIFGASDPAARVKTLKTLPGS